MILWISYYLIVSLSTQWALKTIWCHDSWFIPELFLFTQLSPLLICIQDKVSNSERQDNTQEWGSMIHHMMSLLTLALVTCLLGPGHVSGAWPVVTWHGAGGTASECDKMIETIRWEQSGIIGIQQLMMAAISIRVNTGGIMVISHFATQTLGQQRQIACLWPANIFQFQSSQML